MLAVEIGLHPFHPAWLSRMVFREEDLRAIPPEHQNVPLFRAEKSTKAQQFAIGVIGRTIVRRHICIEKPNSYAVAIASTRASCKATQIPGNAFDQKVLLTQQPCIARDDPLAVAELPTACPRYDHCRDSN